MQQGTSRVAIMLQAAAAAVVLLATSRSKAEA